MTARAFDEQGYYSTGDLFEIAGDRLQFYRYAGRSKDLVIRGGMNISAEEIEGLLLACPGVREVAVVGVPDAVLGEKVCACVVAARGPDAGTCTTSCTTCAPSNTWPPTSCPNTCCRCQRCRAIRSARSSRPNCAHRPGPWSHGTARRCA